MHKGLMRGLARHPTVISSLSHRSALGVGVGEHAGKLLSQRQSCPREALRMSRDTRGSQ